MAKTRLELQSFLEELLGSRNVYFQPPASIHMNYPAIVYKLASIDNTKADNVSYLQDNAYEITFITESPDDPMIFKFAKLDFCRFNRFYTADNLNNYIYTLYY
jgi:hypothetical protein